MTAQTFAGSIALVTGAASGIGAATTELLVRGGATVVAADVDEPGLVAIAARLGDACAPVPVDVSHPSSVAQCFDRIVAEYGALDIVVHAAGIDDPVAKEALGHVLESDGPALLTPGISEIRWHRLVAVNLEGTFNVLRESLRHLCPRGSGSVVVVGSSAAVDAPAGIAHYVATKAGVHGLCASVAKEAIGFGVRVNVVAPGPTRTGMADRTPAPLRAVMSENGRRAYLEPEEIAATIGYLCSDASSAVAGDVVLANAGRFTR